MQIEELHAEIKHAFADLERNEAARQGLENKAEELTDQLDDAMQHIEHLKEKLTSKAAELEAAHSAHKQAQVATVHDSCNDARCSAEHSSCMSACKSFSGGGLARHWRDG